ncbi:hypothetical protein Gpo141_00013942 [Globisporangium polare]
MGCASSNEAFLATPLSAQTDFPFDVNKRFVQQRTTTLVLSDNFWGAATGPDGYAVKDAFTGKVVFRVETSVSGVVPNEKTKWLTDAYKIPIAHLNEVWTDTTAYDLFVGKDEAHRLTQIDVKYIPMDRNPVKALTQALDTGVWSGIGIHGLWRQRVAFIYLDEGMVKHGSRQAVAKVFRAPANREAKFGSSEYLVEIAPGVDAAFIVMACGALDDALTKDIETQ